MDEWLALAVHQHSFRGNVHIFRFIPNKHARTHTHDPAGVPAVVCVCVFGCFGTYSMSMKPHLHINTNVKH